MSTKPATASAASVSGSHVDAPQTIVHAPKRTTTTISVGPAARLERAAGEDQRRRRSAPTAGAAAQDAEAHRPDVEDVARVDREQRDRPAEEHGEEVERDRAEQHLRPPDEPERRRRARRRRPPRSTFAARAPAQRSAISAPGEPRTARRQTRRPPRVVQANSRPPIAGPGDHGGRARDRPQRDRARDEIRPARPPASARRTPASRSRSRTPVAPASRKYGQTTPASATVTASSADRDAHHQRRATSPRSGGAASGRRGARPAARGAAAGRTRRGRPGRGRAGSCGSRTPATRPRPRSCSRRSASTRIADQRNAEVALAGAPGEGAVAPVEPSNGRG